MTKYHQYLLGRHFKLPTDHKPLITLRGEHKPVPQLAAARIKRWALLLAAYDYTRGKDNVFADFLFRKPIKYKQSAAEQVTVNVMFIEDQFLNASVVAMETSNTLERCYSLLSRVGQIIWNQCSNLTTAKGLNSLTKMVSSCRTRELLYQSLYRAFYFGRFACRTLVYGYNECRCKRLFVKVKNRIVLTPLIYVEICHYFNRVQCLQLAHDRDMNGDGAQVTSVRNAGLTIYECS